VIRGRLARADRVVLLDLKAPQGLRDPQAQRVLLGRQDRQAPPDRKAMLVLLVQQGQQAPRAPRDLLEDLQASRSL